MPAAIDIEEARSEAFLERQPVIGSRFAHALVVFVLEHQRVAAREQAGQQLLFVGRKLLAAGRRLSCSSVNVRPNPRIPDVLANAQIALHREAQHRRGETLVVVTHAHEIAHRGRRLALGRFVLGNRDASRRVAADLRPYQVVVSRSAAPGPAGRDSAGSPLLGRSTLSMCSAGDQPARPASRM